MKAPHNEELPYSYCKLVEVSLKGSFADAEIFENVAQDLVSGDFADDCAKVVKGLAKVLGDEVGGDSGVEAGTDSGKRGVDVLECLVMTQISDHSRVAVA